MIGQISIDCAHGMYFLLLSTYTLVHDVGTYTVCQQKRAYKSGSAQYTTDAALISSCAGLAQMQVTSMCSTEL